MTPGMTPGARAPAEPLQGLFVGRHRSRARVPRNDPLTRRTPTAPLNGGALSLPLSSIAEQYRHASCVGLAPPLASASAEFTHPSATARCVPAGTMAPIAARNIWLAS